MSLMLQYSVYSNYVSTLALQMEKPSPREVALLDKVGQLLVSGGAGFAQGWPSLRLADRSLERIQGPPNVLKFFLPAPSF